MSGLGKGKFRRESRMDRKRTSGRNISFLCKLNYPSEMLRSQVRPKLCSLVIFQQNRQKRKFIPSFAPFIVSGYLSFFRYLWVHSQWYPRHKQQMYRMRQNISKMTSNLYHAISVGVLDNVYSLIRASCSYVVLTGSPPGDNGTQPYCSIFNSSATVSSEYCDFTMS